MKTKRKADKFIVGLAIALGLLFQFLLISSPLLLPVIKRNFSEEYKRCYALIKEDFETADTNNLFKIDDAYSRGPYYYNISVAVGTKMSQQEYFDEYENLIQKIIGSMAQDTDSELWKDEFVFRLYFNKGWEKLYIESCVRVHDGSKAIDVMYKTNIFADYSSLNNLVSDDTKTDVSLSLREENFSDEEIETIDEQKENFLFDLIWYSL